MDQEVENSEFVFTVDVGEFVPIGDTFTDDVAADAAWTWDVTATPALAVAAETEVTGDEFSVNEFVVPAWTGMGTDAGEAMYGGGQCYAIYVSGALVYDAFA